MYVYNSANSFMNAYSKMLAISMGHQSMRNTEIIMPISMNFVRIIFHDIGVRLIVLTNI